MVANRSTISQVKNMAKASPEAALKKVEALIKNYPYFLAVRVIELDILKQLNHKSYKKALRNCALQTSHRSVLYEHLHNLSEQGSEVKKILSHPSEENIHSFLHWLELVDEATAERVPSKFDWIDDFLAQNPKISSQGSKAKKEDLTKKQNLATNEIMTETLAHLYWKQKKYAEAKSAFKILSLKYPEKSGLFADQIKQIESELSGK
jgi:predicted Zn-dependent protease